VIACPACRSPDTTTVRQQSIAGAAEHFVPRARDTARHEALVDHLEGLWGDHGARILDCRGCGFGFVHPYVGGDERFYALANAADPHYPADRWEFTETLDALESMDPEPEALAEVGAGKGAFLDKVRSRGLRCRLTAADFDAGAVAAMQTKGIDAYSGSLAEVADRGPFDVVCLFHTLEHMADLDYAFTAIRRSVTSRGSIFVSVPNHDWTKLQESLTQFLDMPPNHVGRWTARAFEAVADRHGLRIVDQRLAPVSVPSQAWLLSLYKVNARAFDPGTLAHRILAVRGRPVRGPAKAALALLYYPRLASAGRRYLSPVRWVHMTPASA